MRLPNFARGRKIDQTGRITSRGVGNETKQAARTIVGPYRSKAWPFRGIEGGMSIMISLCHVRK